jgi:hypothetical protein
MRTAGREKVYKFVAPADGVVRFNVTGDSGYAGLAVLADGGQGCDTNQCLWANWSYSMHAFSPLSVRAGATYYVIVDAQQGSVSYQLSVTCTLQPTAGDAPPPGGQTTPDGGVAADAGTGPGDQLTDADTTGTSPPDAQQADSTPADTGPAYPMCPADDGRTITVCRRQNYWNGFLVYEYYVKDGHTCAVCQGAPDPSGGSCTVGNDLCVSDCNQCGVVPYLDRGRLSIIVPQ